MWRKRDDLFVFKQFASRYCFIQKQGSFFKNTITELFYIKLSKYPKKIFSFIQLQNDVE